MQYMQFVQLHSCGSDGKTPYFKSASGLVMSGAQRSLVSLAELHPCSGETNVVCAPVFFHTGLAYTEHSPCLACYGAAACLA